jgi:hypothetical protein
MNQLQQVDLEPVCRPDKLHVDDLAAVYFSPDYYTPEMCSADLVH